MHSPNFTLTLCERFHLFPVTQVRKLYLTRSTNSEGPLPQKHLWDHCDGLETCPGAFLPLRPAPTFDALMSFSQTNEIIKRVFPFFPRVSKCEYRQQKTKIYYSHQTGLRIDLQCSPQNIRAFLSLLSWERGISTVSKATRGPKSTKETSWVQDD